MSNGIDCATVKANAQADQSDPRWEDDNTDFAVNCIGLNPLGWGYDYAHAYVYLEPGTNALYVCIDTYGHPGDADGDGGYGSNLNVCGGWNNTCPASEGADPSVIFSASEEVNLRVDRDCDGFPDLGFRLSNDEIRIALDSFNPGNVGTVVGVKGSSWAIAPEVPSGGDLVGDPLCDNPRDREGAIIFCIEDFNTYFDLNAGQSPAAFDWRVSGGHADDEFSEDSVRGIFNEGNPSVEIVKETSTPQLCGIGDTAFFTVTVRNNGNIALEDVIVTDDLPAGLAYGGIEGACDFGDPQIAGQTLTWNLGVLLPGEERSCNFFANVVECVGDIRNNTAVVGDVMAMCVLRGNPGFSVTDEAFVDLTCETPGVALEFEGAETCVGATVLVPVTVRNTSSVAADLTVDCTVGGVAQPQQTFSDVPPNGEMTFDVSVTCDTPEDVVVACEASAVLVGVGQQTECRATQSLERTVICREATVAIDVNPQGETLQACVDGAPLLVPVDVTNTSLESASITVTCTVDGVPQAPQDLGVVTAGDTRNFDVTVVCDEVGEVEIICEVTATLESNPECTATARDTDTAICRQALVSLDINPDGGPLAACVGATLNVPVKVTNDSAEEASVVVVCTVDGVPTEVFNQLLASGAMGTFDVPVTCDEVGEVDIACTATATLTSDPNCTATGNDNDTVICREALVSLDVNPEGGPLTACVDATVQVPVQVTNDSAEEAEISVICTVGGVAQPAFNVTLPAGGMDTFNVPVLCEEPGDVLVACTASAALTADRDCTDEASDEATVICREATVAIDVNPDADPLMACVGAAVNVPVKVTNTSLEDAAITVICTVGGIQQAPVNLGVLPANGMDTFNVPVTCDEVGTVPVSCSVTATLVSNDECTASATDVDNVTCREALVSLEVNPDGTPLETCVGATILVPVKVTNDSAEEAEINVACLVDGVDQGPIFMTLAAGAMETINLNVLCDEAGSIPVVCSATASLTADPNCTDDASDEATVICRLATVEIDVQDEPDGIEACVGQTVQVPVKVINTSNEAADLVVTCTVDGVPQAATFNAVLPGGMETFNIPVTCTEVGTVEIDCSVTATLTANPECTAEARDTGAVHCMEAAVEILAEDVDACVGDPISIPVTIRNTSQGTEDFVVNCSVNGVALPPIEIPNVAAGDIREISIPAACDEGGSVPVVCSVVATLDGAAECMAEDEVAVTLTCYEALVEVETGDAEGCVGETVLVPVTVTNRSTDPALIEVECTINGETTSPGVFVNVPVGESRTFNVEVLCDEPGQVQVECLVRATLLCSVECIYETTVESTVTCRQALVSIESDDLETCVGATVNVPFSVTNDSGEPANLTVTCTVNGVAQAPVELPNMAAGAVEQLQVPVTCEEVGVVEVVCDVTATLVSDPDCAAEARATGTVTCLEACLEVSAENVEVCVGETAVLMVKLENCSEGAQDYTLDCTIDGQPLAPVTVENVPAGETATVPVEVACEEGDVLAFACTVTAALSDNEECTATATLEAQVTCLAPEVEIVKSTDPETTQDASKVTIVVTNTGTSVLDPVRVSDHLPAGLDFDPNQPILSDWDIAVADVHQTEHATWVTFTDFALEPGQACTLMYDIDCTVFDNEARVDTAMVTAWCEGILDTDPEFPGVTDSDTAQVVCIGGEACPRTIGFWRSQCDQKGNGSTKICQAGMETLWRHVIQRTGVEQWKRNDGSYESTAELAALSDGDLFERLCSQLYGPRPMTSRDMAELQYLALLLNVDSEALPLTTTLENSGGFSGTVAQAIAGIEDALNNGGNINYWKSVADAINNRQGVIADDCPDGNDRFRNVPPCNGTLQPDSPITELSLTAYPNPATEAGTVIRYSVPEHLANSNVMVEIFDVSGRLVRRLVEDRQASGQYEVSWDLRDGAGKTVSAGIYFYCLRGGAEARTQRLLVMQQ